MKSLDPRVNRLPTIENAILPKAPLDQFGTFEVFVEPKEGKPFQHEGVVHAPDIELAFVLAKEAFTRRFACTSLAVVDTRHVFVSETTDGNTNAYDRIAATIERGDTETSFEIFHLPKRGKQHIHAAQIFASSYADAMLKSKNAWPADKIVYNIWAIRTTDVRYTTEDEKDLWLTLPEKKFRDAGDYKGGDKLKGFLESNTK